MMSKECSEMVGRFEMNEDEEYCKGFIDAWNSHVCAVDGLLAAIEGTEERLDALAEQLDETMRELAAMTEGFNMLADRMRDGR